MANLIKASELQVGELQAAEAAYKPLLDAFQAKLDTPPDPKIVKKLQNIKYVPIEIVEAMLDKYFAGAWEITNIRHSIEINACVVTIDLRVYHPIRHIWITRSGIGSVPVQLDKSTKAIKPNALQKNLPAARAIALKNAAQTLGRTFGRNLNRGLDVPYREDTANFNNIII